MLKLDTEAKRKGGMFVHINILSFWVGIAWCGVWFFSALISVGEMTNGPYLITWWDVIWLPAVAAVFPFVLGMSVRLKRR